MIRNRSRTNHPCPLQLELLIAGILISTNIKLPLMSIPIIYSSDAELTGLEDSDDEFITQVQANRAEQGVAESLKVLHWAIASYHWARRLYSC
ncbi:MAG: hypothetical protein JWR35_3848 [Marmoricola sp.]|nr:hypothetical protein [Marmoricola sp.]